LTLASGATGTLTISLTLSATLPTGNYYGDIQLTGGTVPLNLPYWVNVDPPASNGHGCTCRPI
jgi:hypothetical protein